MVGNVIISPYYNLVIYNKRNSHAVTAQMLLTHSYKFMQLNPHMFNKSGHQAGQNFLNKPF